MVLKVERIGLISVSRVWKNQTSRSRLGLAGSTSRSRLGLEGSTSWSHLGLEDTTSRSRSRDFNLVNMHAMGIYHEENNGSDPLDVVK